MNQPSIIVITGPTASGKTSIGIDVAKRIGGEIINADSVQVYKDFNIAAAKPSAEELAEVPHHLVSAIDPRVAFDTNQFCVLAQKKITEIWERGAVPIISGGTGLYLRSLLCGLVDIESVDEKLKRELEDEITSNFKDEQNPALKLHEMLQEIDPQSAAAIHSNDVQRVKRAILVRRSTGKSFIELQEKHSHGSPQYRALVMVLTPNKEELNKKINARVSQMIDIGLLDEVKSLLSRYPLNARPFGAIGYRHVAEYLRGDYGFDKMVENLKRDTRRFAKRQRTWWRNQPRFLGWENVTAPFLKSVDGKSGSDVFTFMGEFLNCPNSALNDSTDSDSKSELLDDNCLRNPTFSKDRDTRKIYFFEYDRL